MAKVKTFCDAGPMPARKQGGLADAALAAGAPLVAAIYDRVSTDRSGIKRSVGEQGDTNREVCEAQGWTIGVHLADNDRSASRFATKKRDAWNELRGDLQMDKYHVLVLWESSRGDRRLADWIALLDLCRDKGILIHITSHRHTYDVRRRRDYKTLAEEGLDSADDSEKTSERVLRTVEATAMKGLPHGQVQFGYHRQYEIDATGQRRLRGQFPDERPRRAGDGALLEDLPDEVRDALEREGRTFTAAAVVREIFERLAKGEASRSLARDLNQRGVPPPKGAKEGWSGRTIRRIADNHTYLGLRKHHGATYPAVWPPLVEKAVFETVGNRLRDPARRTSHESEVKYLGSNLYVCGVCGETARPASRKPTPVNPSNRAYACWPRRPVGTPAAHGFHVVREVTAVDDYVERSIWLRLSQPDVMELLTADDEADQRTAALAEEILDKQARLNEARDAFAAGELPVEALKRIEARLAPEIGRAQAQIGRARVGVVLDGLISPTLDDVIAAWRDRSLPERREVIRVLTERVEILPLHNRKKYKIEESVRIVWRGPGKSTSEDRSVAAVEAP
jgi:DNA invertase Pin-like site-specific DNA recombinase